jgi:hypothetical protein
MLATKNGHLEVVKCLMEAGAGREVHCEVRTELPNFRLFKTM